MRSPRGCRAAWLSGAVEMAASIAGSSSSRRGRRGRRRGLMAEINVTPFVDVMLVLLIVFMVTAPLLTAGVDVSLPKTEARQLSEQDRPLTITVQANGSVFIQETEIEMDALLPRLEALAKEGQNSRIFIRADEKAEYGVVADVMARMSTAGYSNLALVTEPRVSERRGER